MATLPENFFQKKLVSKRTIQQVFRCHLETQSLNTIYKKSVTKILYKSLNHNRNNNNSPEQAQCYSLSGRQIDPCTDFYCQVDWKNSTLCMTRLALLVGIDRTFFESIKDRVSIILAPNRKSIDFGQVHVISWCNFPWYKEENYVRLQNSEKFRSRARNIDILSLALLKNRLFYVQQIFWYKLRLSLITYHYKLLTENVFEVTWSMIFTR